MRFNGMPFTPAYSIDKAWISLVPHRCLYPESYSKWIIPFMKGPSLILSFFFLIDHGINITTQGVLTWLFGLFISPPLYNQPLRTCASCVTCEWYSRPCLPYTP